MDRAEIKKLQQTLAQVKDLAPRMLQIVQALAAEACPIAPGEHYAVPAAIIHDARSVLQLLGEVARG